MNQIDQNSKHKAEDHRQYVRLHGRFPVQFSIVRLQGDLPGLEWQEATTVNLHRKGICIETPHLTESIIKYFKSQNIFLELRMKIPPQLPHIHAVCDVVWYKKQGSENNPHYAVGLKFRSVHQKEIERVMFHARMFHFVRASVYVICTIMFLALVAWAAKHHFKF